MQVRVLVQVHVVVRVHAQVRVQVASKAIVSKIERGIRSTKKNGISVLPVERTIRSSSYKKLV